MKFNLLLFISLTLIPPLTNCNVSKMNEDEPEPFERRKLPRELSAGELQVVDSSGDFGFNLMHRLLNINPDESHFISPLSIQMAYGMAMNGADGETYSQMQEVFGLEGMSREQINQASLDLFELLIRFDDDVRFDIANSIWYRNTFEVENEFLDINSNYYDAMIEPAAFDEPETVNRINQWVDDRTKGLIEEIVQGPIDPLTVMYLINAIYFNGDWTVQFDPDKTETKPFYRSDGTSVDAEMMHMENEQDLLYTRGEDYQAVNLYYGNAGFAMTLVLPDEEVGLESWLTGMDWNKWQELTENFNDVTLTLEMPRFETEYEVEEFKQVLQEMGITDAFSPNAADFSRINAKHEDLHISDTRHKTFIRVDEEGTEAAAVTSLEMRVTSVPQSVEISFDRPFFYVIREVESETILFMGTMTNPSS